MSDDGDYQAISAVKPCKNDCHSVCKYDSIFKFCTKELRDAWIMDYKVVPV